MPFIPITSEMQAEAYKFSEKIIRGDNQYNRMIPAYARDPQAETLVRINRTYAGKLAELCFYTYLCRNGIHVDITGMFEIYEGQAHVDAFDFRLPDGRTIDVKAAVFKNHRNLVIPIDQFRNAPKDFYVGVKLQCDLEGNDYTHVHQQTFGGAEIRGFCTYEVLQRCRDSYLGEFPCKSCPLDALQPIDGLIGMFGN